MPEGEELGDGIAEAVEGWRAGVRLVAPLDAGPLLGGHGAGAGVGQQIHEDVLGGYAEEVVARGCEDCGPLFAGGHPHGLHGVHPERLDDGSEAGISHASKLPVG